MPWILRDVLSEALPPHPSAARPGPGLDELPTAHPLGLGSTQPRGFHLCSQKFLNDFSVGGMFLFSSCVLDLFPFPPPPAIIWICRRGRQTETPSPHLRLVFLSCSVLPVERPVSPPRGRSKSLGEAFCLLYVAHSQVEWFCSHGHWQCPERFLVFTTGGGRRLHLAGQGHDALILPRCSGQPPP